MALSAFKAKPKTEERQGRTTIMRSVRSVVDTKRILDVLLRNLVQKRTITPADLDTILGITIRKVADTVNAQAVTVFTVDEKTDRIKFQNVYYSPSLHGRDDVKRRVYERKADELERMTLPLGQGIVGQVISEGKSAFVADARSDPRFCDQVDQETGFVTVSVIAVPLKVDDKVIGCIEVLNKCPDGKTVMQFTEADVYLVEDVAGYSARIICRAQNPDTPFGDREMAGYVARLAKCEYVELAADVELDLLVLEHLGEDALKRYRILPLARIGDKGLKVALTNPLDFQAINDFEIVSGYKVVEKVVVAEEDMTAVVNKYFPEDSQVGEVAEAVSAEYGDLGISDEAGDGDDDEDENSAPIVRLANRIIEDAYVQGASDIHIEPYEDKIMVRYRIDGLLKEKLSLPKKAHRALVSRLKIMSELDISERRLPQDGRIVFKKFNSSYDLDLRVSIAPVNFGEKICMRILDKTKSTLPLDKLGFSSYNIEMYRDLILAPYGMILHCGPTGSGKSMTLYAALNEINSPEVNISTAEDPIEYTLKGINQMQMHKQIGLTFAAALRCYLRQDPDIILVGEIRDKETAEIAIEAALTGHLLLSTLHTNDAPTTIPRFTEMGVEAFMVSTSLICVCAQRLLRRLCDCKQEDEPNEEERLLLGRARDDAPVTKIWRPVGCDKCNGSGYKGRTGIHELLKNTDELRSLINRGASAEELRTAARQAGMRTLFEDCMEKVKKGVTSLPEALGTARPDDTIIDPE